MMAAARCLALVSLLFQLHAATGQPRTEAQPTDFLAFVVKHGRQYSKGSKEFEERRTLFDQRVAEVNRHNLRKDRKWTAAVNHLTDWNEVELKVLRGWKGKAHKNQGQQSSLLQMSSDGGLDSLPKHKIWKNNATLADTDQGACGSCWAVATATTLNAHSEIHRPSSVRRFSAQELVSCVPNPDHCGGTGGCKGATVELAMDYVMRNGLDTPLGTPYEASDLACSAPSDSMLYNSGEHVLLQVGTHAMMRDKRAEIEDSQHHTQSEQKGQRKNTGLDIGREGFRESGAEFGTKSQLFGMFGWERLPENNYLALLRAVAEHGPVAISASASEWSSYGGGIFDECFDSVIDHAVTLIGYGVDDYSKDKFYTIKNSWGNLWGEGGTIRLLRKDTDDTVQCGVDNQPDVGTGCDGGPSKVKVCGMCGILYDSVVPHFCSAGWCGTGCCAK